jgi:uncharacterized membrane protein (DUF485 family)
MTQPGNSTDQLRALTQARSRIAISLTIAMIVIYFGFIGLIAFEKELLARKIVPGLSLGILLGALVIVVSWLLTWFYVRWANAHYDTALKAIGDREAGEGAER